MWVLLFLVIETEVKLKLVKEWKFDKPIKDVMWGETEKGEVYPKIVIISDARAEVYEKKGNKKFVLDMGLAGRVRISKKGKYIGGRKVIAFPEQEERNTEVSYILYDANGKKYCEVPCLLSYEEDRIMSISESGNFVLIDCQSNRIEFYNKQGDLLRKVDLFSDDQWQDVSNLKYDWAQNGKYFVVFAAKDYLVHYWEMEALRSSNSYVILFDGNGNELWRSPFPKKFPMIISVAISDKGNYILALGSSPLGEKPSKVKAILYGKSGEKIWETSNISDGLVRTFCTFAQNEHCAVVGNMKRVIFLEINENGAKILWDKELPQPVFKAQITPDNEVLLISREPGKGAICLHYNQRGRLIERFYVGEKTSVWAIKKIIKREACIDFLIYKNNKFEILRKEAQ